MKSRKSNFRKILRESQGKRELSLEEKINLQVVDFAAVRNIIEFLGIQSHGIKGWINYLLD